jgi:hypothetical protein
MLIKQVKDNKKLRELDSIFIISLLRGFKIFENPIKRLFLLDKKNYLTFLKQIQSQKRIYYL